VATTTLAALFAVALASSLLTPEPPAPLRAAKRFEINIGPTQLIGASNVHAYPVLSPDGTQLVYAAILGDDGAPRLYIRGIDQLDARELAGTEGAYAPFFSPNGQWVGYFVPTEQSLRKVSVQGGQPLTLSAAYPPLGGTWLEDGTIIFTSQTPGAFTLLGQGASLFRVPDAGGTPERLTTADQGSGEAYHGYPRVLPGGEAVIFTIAGATGGQGRIVALSLETGELRTLVDVGFDARYSPTGHLVFARQGALWAAPFDPERLEVTGQEVVVVQGIEMSPFAVPFSFSPDGLLVYMPGEAAVGATSLPRSLVWVDRQGNEEPLPLPVRQYLDPRLSPDGSRVAVGVFDGQDFDLWVYDVTSGRGLRLTHEGAGPITVPIWTPEGGRIVFRSVDETGNGDLFWIAADGSGAPEPLVTSDTDDEFSTSVSADGRAVIYSRIVDPGPNLHREIWEVPLDGDRTPRPLLQGQFAYGNASLSPDGRWLAYFSDESGEFEIYLQPYPGPGPKTPVSIGGGQEVVWSRDGTELFYRLGSTIMVVDVQSQPTLTVSEPRVLFQSSHFFVPGGGSRQYHVAPDGRFLMIRSGAAEVGEPADYDHLIVVENWLDELQRLVPRN